MRTFIFALLAATVVSSCGYFSNKVNDVMVESGKQLDRQTDSLKNVIVRLRYASMSDSVFGAKFDTLCDSGFKLADISKRVTNNPGDTLAMQQQLKYFTNYVVKILTIPRRLRT